MGEGAVCVCLCECIHMHVGVYMCVHVSVQPNLHAGSAKKRHQLTDTNNAGIYSKCIILRQPSFTQLLFMNTPKMTLEVPICLHCISDVNSETLWNLTGDTHLP